MSDITAREVFKQLGSSSISEIKARFTATDANATGKTAGSLRDEYSDKVFTLYGSKAFRYTETGRRAGKMPPMAPIIEWMNARNIPLSAKWAVRMGIAKRGTVTVSQSRPRDIFTSVLSESKIRSVVHVIAENTNNQITSDIVKSFKQ